MRITRFIYRCFLKLNFSLRSFRYRTYAKWTSTMKNSSLYWPASTVARVPVRCDGYGTVIIGEGVSLGYHMAPRYGNGEILLQARSEKSQIRIGKSCNTSNNISIVCMHSIEIGDNCLIGDCVTIIDSDFHRVDPSNRHNGHEEPKPVRIGRNVWLGSRVLILKGVTIGDNTVVAAGSIVTSPIPPNVIAGGVPAKVLRNI